MTHENNDNISQEISNAAALNSESANYEDKTVYSPTTVSESIGHQKSTSDSEDNVHHENLECQIEQVTHIQQNDEPEINDQVDFIQEKNLLKNDKFRNSELEKNFKNKDSSSPSAESENTLIEVDNVCIEENEDLQKIENTLETDTLLKSNASINLIEISMEQTSGNINKTDSEKISDVSQSARIDEKEYNSNLEPLDTENIISDSDHNDSILENKSLQKEVSEIIDSTDFLSDESNNQNIKTKIDIQKSQKSELNANQEGDDKIVQYTDHTAVVDIKEQTSENLQEIEIYQNTDFSVGTIDLKCNIECSESKKTEELEIKIVDNKILQSNQVLSLDAPSEELMECSEISVNAIKNRSNEELKNDSPKNNLETSQSLENSPIDSLKMDNKHKNVEKASTSSDRKEEIENDSMIEQQIFSKINKESIDDSSDIKQSENIAKINNENLPVKTFSDEFNETVTDTDVESEAVVKEKEDNITEFNSELQQEELDPSEKTRNINLKKEIISSEENLKVEKQDSEKSYSSISFFQDFSKKVLQKDISEDRKIQENIKASEILDNVSLSKFQSSDVESSSSNEIENKLDLNMDELLEPQQNIENLTESETFILQDTEAVSFIQDSQNTPEIHSNSADEKLLNQEKDDFEFQSAEKEDDISLVFEESSQSPKELQNENFEDNLFNKYEQNTIESEDVALESNEETKLMNACKNEELNRSLTAEISEFSSEPETLKQVENTEHLLNQATCSKPDFEPLTEVSELESAVKFLQESEKQVSDLPSVGDPISERSSSIYVSVEDSECDHSFASVSKSEISTDPIAISESEIISEAAKLESERVENLEEQQEQESLLEGADDVTITESNLPTEHEKLSVKITNLPENQEGDNLIKSSSEVT